MLESAIRVRIPTTMCLNLLPAGRLQADMRMLLHLCIAVPLGTVITELMPASHTEASIVDLDRGLTVVARQLGDVMQVEEAWSYLTDHVQDGVMRFPSTIRYLRDDNEPVRISMLQIVPSTLSLGIELVASTNEVQKRMPVPYPLPVALFKTLIIQFARGSRIKVLPTWDAWVPRVPNELSASCLSDISTEVRGLDEREGIVTTLVPSLGWLESNRKRRRV